MESIIKEESAFIKIKKQMLLEMGFSFVYTTHIYKNKQGKNYFYCYEYGYFLFDEEWCIIIKNETLKY